MAYQVHDIKFEAEILEQLGTKEKFWFEYTDGEVSKLILFKYSRKNTGEHWSEKVAAELCQLLEIPHTYYDLATCGGRIGVITPNITPSGSRMVMGNEVLHTLDGGEYPSPIGSEEIVRVREHTVTRVLGCLDSGILPPETSCDIQKLNAGDVFCGYLMLDTLISNQDRHHENWAIFIDGETTDRYLCPSYDHAASLGRELLDEERIERLSTNDNNRKVEAFVLKARSELFRGKTERKPMLTLDAFLFSVSRRGQAKAHWLQKLQGLTMDKIEAVFSDIPAEIISEPARKFAMQMVLENRKRLLNHE